MSIIKDIPTSSKRRISQCLILSNKLKMKIVELDKEKDLTNKLQTELNKIADERDIYKSVADTSKQP